MTKIPNINSSLDNNKLSNIIHDNYSEISKEYMTFITQWLIDGNKVFNDNDMFYILVYLFNKNLEFYNNNLVIFDYETFNNTDTFQVNKINIIDISKKLYIPKETVRRKIVELEKKRIIKRRKKNIEINKNNLNLFDIKSSIKDLSNLLIIVYNICLKTKLIDKEVSKEEIILTINKNFSFVMFQYFEFIIPWIIRWKNFFNNDIEQCLIWSVIVLNKSAKLKKINNILNVEYWRSEIGELPGQGINTMSLSDVCGIPRPTVSRKIKKLLNKKIIFIDQNKLIHPILHHHKNEVAELQDITLDSFSKFSSILFNLIVFK